MPGRELLGRAERAVSYVRSLAARFTALETAFQEATAAREGLERRLATLETELMDTQARTGALETAWQGSNRTSAEVPEDRFQEHARAIQQLQDRIIRLERSNRELAVRIEQLREVPLTIHPVRAVSA